MGKNIIGAAYDQNSREIAKHIFENKAKSDSIKPEGHACYFCRKKISGNVNAVAIKEKNGNSIYYLDDFCYATAKHTGIRNDFGVLN